MRSQPNFSLTEGIIDLRPTPLKKKCGQGLSNGLPLNGRDFRFQRFNNKSTGLANRKCNSFVIYGYLYLYLIYFSLILYYITFINHTVSRF